MRLALGIEYDGSAYCGWQRQRQGESVQGVLEGALSFVADESLKVTCAGRTDAGVHAVGQVAHFDTAAERSPRSWALGANSRLPADVAVRWVEQVDDEFHARFSAVSRSYRYLVLNRRLRSALHRERACWVHRPLDVAAMQEAADALVGEHDFSAFRAAGCQARTPVREIARLAVTRLDDWVVMDVTANAFLQHMVRNIAGLLIVVGAAEAPPALAAEVLAGRERRVAPFAAPAAGLTLMAVRYPAHFGLPAGAALDARSPLPV